MRFEKSSSKFLPSLGLAGIIALLVYLFDNISKVGSAGTALPLLGTFFVCAVLVSMCLSLKKILYVRIHLILFFLFIAWIAFRVIVDINDLERLKSITIATTGGIILFFLVGAFVSLILRQTLVKSRKNIFFIGVLLFYLGLLICLHFKLAERVRPDIFLIADLDGAYQRPGNFLSISFIVISFMIFTNTLRLQDGKDGRVMYAFILILYTSQMLLALVASQLFGSNSATGVVLGVYFTTLTMILTVNNKILYSQYALNLLTLWSKRVLRRLILFVLISISAFAMFLSAFLHVLEFNLANINIFGFGLGEINSLDGRIEITLSSGLDQLAYSPIFGNMNVAYYTTGNEGRTLHSFFLYVIANLGIIGLTIVLMLFFLVIRQLMQEVVTRKSKNVFSDFYSGSLALYSLGVFLFILLFANISTDVSWIVLWFTLGMVSKPFGFKSLHKSVGDSVDTLPC
jgi:hypothetical protein